MNQLTDQFGRIINYIRLSVTEHCNYRCFYCRDEYHYPDGDRRELLTYEETARIIRIFAGLGVTKVRLTGGEPLIRKDIDQLIFQLSQIPEITDIPLSTNAHLLAKKANMLKEKGVTRVNISLDSLKVDRFRDITRGGDLESVLAGIDAAILAGLTPIKINMVVMKGLNDDEIEPMIDFVVEKGIDLRFIETMPIGTAGIGSVERHYPESEILYRVRAHTKNGISRQMSGKTDGPARNFILAGSPSKIGVISAVSNHFCATCNRLRLSSKGQLILCLGQENAISLRDAVRLGKSDTEVRQMIVDAVNLKPEKHDFNTEINRVEVRQMSEIGG